MDAAFKAFQSQTGLEEFKGFAFELQTCAHQYFARNNIKEYLGLIFGFQGGKEACRTITHYIIIVLSKYLRMMAAFHVHKMDEEALAADYEFFNASFDNILAVYREVVREKFAAGNLPSLESVKKNLEFSKKSTGVTEVNPEPRKAKSSSAEGDKQVSEFLQKLELAELIPMFAREGITMLDMADLTNSDLKNFGVDQFRQRKVLLRAVEDLNKQQPAVQVTDNLRRLGQKEETIRTVQRDQGIATIAITGDMR